MMGWSKATYIMSFIMILLELPLIVTFLIKIPLLGLGFVALTGFVVWLLFKVIHTNRYIVEGDEIVVKLFWTKARRYRIDKIQKIEYIDFRTDWGGTPPNLRYQLAIYFERGYVKSADPFLFGPKDRDGFVDALLETDPGIPVCKNDEPVEWTRCYKIG